LYVLLENGNIESDPLNVSQAQISLYNGITHGSYIPRNKIIEEVKRGLISKGMMIISSPRASGKSSLLQIVRSVKPIEGARYLYVKFSKDKEAFQQLQTKTGLSYHHREERWCLEVEDPEIDKIVLIIDDAQFQYENSDFWETLFKSCSTFPVKNFYFIIAATYLLTGGDSPIECNNVNIPRLRFGDLKVTETESSEIIDSREMGLHKPMNGFMLLKKLIKNECDGHIGALRMTIDRLNTINNNTPLVREEDAIAQFFDINLGVTYSRCWSFEMTEEQHQFIKSQITFILSGVDINYDEANTEVKNLIKAGILQGSQSGDVVKFSSPLAERYFYSKYFITRAKDVNYTNLEDLATKAIRKMSSMTLSQSIVPGTASFPKEATIQHLFMKSLLSLTKINVKILPELGRTYPIDGIETSTAIPGAIDFYLRNCNFAWGIELLVEGRGVGEHVRRFGEDGKYSRLECTDYIIIDLRRGKPNHGVKKHKKKMTVFFESDNFQVCCLISGESKEIVSMRLES
jgi:hypothetical protein